MTCTLAVACEKDAVAPHFGNSPEFAVFEILENRINGLLQAWLEEEQKRPGDAAHIALLRKLNAKVLLCGALESSARAALEEAGIEIIDGQTGDIIQAAGAFLMKLVRAGK